MEKATFGEGCFWCVEDAYRKVHGVIDAVSGYMGGHLANPTYQDVCSGTTGHAEVVQVEFDPEIITYEQLLNIFWTTHNPTQLNRQGPDVGEQYRSAIFYHTPEQQVAAEASKAEMDATDNFKLPIVTTIEPASAFWRAEEYHQKYYGKQRACRLL
ncbi:MAG: peptide-methionine (S)-S-oxide reductase MsrA [Candidatus Hinthialibacter antarcticus]|nr:peptide-methionine (S)-S-oxide reductase MsrA [Candidatus Hinthialibacter antarcticus]